MAWNHKSRVAVVAIAIQSVAGTFTTPDADDIIPVSVPNHGDEVISAEDPTATGSVWQGEPIILGRTSNASMTAPLRGPGGASPFTAGGWPLGRVLQAAGFAEVITASAITDDTGSGGHTTSAIKLHASASAVDDFYVGMPIQHPDIGTGLKANSVIIDYDGTTKIATLGETMGDTPGDAEEFTIPANVVYQLGTLTTSPPLLSVSIWRDQKRYDYKDVRVSQLSLDMPVANEQNQEFPSIEFSLRGLPEAVDDEASPAIPDAMLTALPPYRNGKFSLDKVPLGHQSTRFSVQFDVAGASNAHQAQGQDSYEILSGQREVEFDLNQMAVADFDLDARIDAQTEISTMSLWGLGAGNRFAFALPRIKLYPFSPGDRNGFVNLTGNATFSTVTKSATLAVFW